MAGGDNSTNGVHDQQRAMEEGRKEDFATDQGCASLSSVPFIQKIIAEIFGTYFLMFAGCGAVTINASKNGQITFPGVAIVWGLAVMVMVYAVGHISGAHFNPAVTFAFATSGRFPWRQLPAYVLAQMLGATLASGTLRLMFGGRHEHFPGTLPTGSEVQSLVIEIITTFYLMFVISGVATDNRAIGELAGLAVGATILLNVLIAGPVSGASMNPARSVGPALVSGQYRSIWVYVVGPVVGAVGLQPDPLHQQASPRDHQEHLLPQEHEQDELLHLIHPQLHQPINSKAMPWMQEDQCAPVKADVPGLFTCEGYFSNLAYIHMCCESIYTMLCDVCVCGWMGMEG